MRFVSAPLLGAIALVTLASPSSAETLKFFANLTDLNGLGASGKAFLTYDGSAETLNVRIKAAGLDPDVTHIQHIHGTFDDAGRPLDAKTPTIAADTGPGGDGDGFIELFEGAPSYGPILFDLKDENGAFPTAPGGMIDFNATYDLATSGNFSGDFGPSDLFPLDFREIVIHGAILGAVGIDNPAVGSFPFGMENGQFGDEADGTAGFKLSLPVLAGEIQPIPLPAAAWMLGAGLAGLFGVGRLRRR